MRQVESTEATAFQAPQYRSHRMTRLPAAKSANDWMGQEQNVCMYIRDEIAFHGWPSEWVQSTICLESP